MRKELEISTLNIKCRCGKGYASIYDNVCKFCREKMFRRTEGVKVGVRHRGDGMTLEQANILREKK